MTVLLTNDDGYQSAGMTSVRDALIEAGIQVISIAPDGPRSGSSRSATFRRPVRIEQVGGDDENPIYACSGTPVDCIRVGMLSTLADHVQLVISGTNEGANLGDDATYSSTAGSAIEGALLGLPAFSISQQSTDRKFRLVDQTGYDWTGSAQLAVDLTRAILDNPPPARSVLNVNVPGADAHPPVQVTRLGRRAWRRGGLVEQHTDEHGTGYYSFNVNDDADPPFHAEPGTDFRALEDGHPSITPLTFAWGVPHATKELGQWLESTVAALNAATEQQVSP